MIKYALVLLFLISSPCHALQVTEVSAILGSYHFDRDKEYNEFNPGAIVTVNSKYQALGYYNSYKVWTFAAGYRFKYEVCKNLQVSATLGAVYGYNWNRGYVGPIEEKVQVLPFVLPSVTYNINNFLISGHFFGSGVALSMGYKFK